MQRPKNKTPYSRKDSYLNNPNLPNEHYIHSYTQWEWNELQKCKVDIEYFIRNYVYIINVDKGLMLFDLYPFQVNLINHYHLNRFSLTLCPRQQGKSQTTMAFILHELIFNSEYKVAILANKLPASQEMMYRLKQMFEYLPNFLQVGVREWNKRSIELANNSKAISNATSSSSVRGDSYNLVLLDEFAHVPTNIAEEFFTSTYPVISSGKTTKMIIISTPKGLNMFYQMWRKAELGKSEYKTFRAYWWDVPGRDEEWKKQTIANTSEKQFAVEFDCEFIGSSNTLISAQKLKDLIETPSLIVDDHFEIYEEPQEDHIYTITVDVAEGLNQDYSAFSITDVTEIPYKQVGRYRNNDIDPLMFPTIIYSTAHKYNTAHVLIEVNSVGVQVANILWDDLGYENLIRVGKNTKEGQIIDDTSQQLGLKTSIQSKRIGCTTLKTLIESEKLIVNDETTIMELRTFISDGKKSWAAEEGNTDDLVMTLVLFAWLTQQKDFMELISSNVRKELTEEKYKLEQTVMPLVFSNGQEMADLIFEDGLDFNEYIWQPL